MKIDLDEAEWSYIISAVAAPVISKIPLIAKITAQLAAQKGNGHAEEQGQRLGEHQEAASRGLPASSGNSDRFE
jgi:hypothetical protein